MTRKASIVSYGDVHETEEMKKEGKRKIEKNYELRFRVYNVDRRALLFR